MRQHDSPAPRNARICRGAARPGQQPVRRAAHRLGPALSATGLAASTRLLLGGLAWLTGCFLLVWIFFTPPPSGPPQDAAPFLGPAPLPTTVPRADTMGRLDALVAQTLPLALPRARWQRTLVPPKDAPADLPLREDITPRRYTVTGPCAPLRLGLALLAAVRATAWPAPPAAGPAHGMAAFPAAGVPDVVWSRAGVLEIRVNGRASHSFHFPGREGVLMDLAQPPALPAMAVIMDDMGQSLEAAQALAALPFPVTLAIWPHAPLAAETARLAEERRMDSLVHLPMEALPRPDGRRPDPGRGALLTHMDAHHLSLTLEEDLQSLPTAIGLNNHMGSAFTGNADACRRLCALLAGRGYLVLDSVTRPQARLAAAAREAGLIAVARDVFLDTRRETRAVLQALDAAARTARRQGWAVAIGHPYGATLAALRAWPDAGGVALVPLRRLVWHWARQHYAHPPIHPNKE